MRKTRWWFAASHFDIKIVILAKFDHGRITIENLVEGWSENMGTSKTAQIQIIHITHLGHDTADPESYDVTVPLVHFDNQLRVNMTLCSTSRCFISLHLLNELY